jgi:hypothetical protein
LDPELQKEWMGVEQDARARLRAHAVRESGYIAEARVAILPSFSDYRAYELLRSTSSDTAPALARRLIWRKTRDLEKFDSPVTRLKYERPIRPTIESLSIEIPLDTVVSLLEGIARAHVPPRLSEDRMGTDGTSYEVAFGRFFANSLFAWWQSPPKGWEPLSDFVKSVQTLVDERLET